MTGIIKGNHEKETLGASPRHRGLVEDITRADSGPFTQKATEPLDGVQTARAHRRTVRNTCSSRCGSVC